MATNKTFKTASEQMAFYFFETLSKLAQGKFTEAELQARREKGKAASLVQAINEIVTPDDVIAMVNGKEEVVGHQPNKYRGTYDLYSQRCFDQGNCGDPHEYTGIKISFRVKDINVQIDTHWGNIQTFGKDGEKYSIGMGKTLIERLDEIGEALWAEYDDSAESMIEKLRNIEDDQTWSYDEDYFYMKHQTWSRPTETRNYSKLQTQFERDIAGGIKYTNRTDDPQAGKPYNRQMFLKYREVIEEQTKLQKEVAEKEIRRKTYGVEAVCARAKASRK